MKATPSNTHRANADLCLCAEVAVPVAAVVYLAPAPFECLTGQNSEEGGLFGAKETRKGANMKASAGVRFLPAGNPTPTVR